MADNTAKPIGDYQATLFGTDATEENNPDRKFLKDKTYRFAYELSIADKNELIQIFGCFPASTESITYPLFDLTFSNMHFIPVSGSVDKANSKLLYFGEVNGIAKNMADCDHAYKEAHDATVSCSSAGEIAHEHCLRCGKNFVNNVEVSSVSLDPLPHTFSELVPATNSTCSVKGHEAYYTCTVCNKALFYDKFMILFNKSSEKYKFYSVLLKCK